MKEYSTLPRTRTTPSDAIQCHTRRPLFLKGRRGSYSSTGNTVSIFRKLTQQAKFLSACLFACTRDLVFILCFLLSVYLLYIYIYIYIIFKGFPFIWCVCIYIYIYIYIYINWKQQQSLLKLIAAICICIRRTNYLDYLIKLNSYYEVNEQLCLFRKNNEK